MNCEVLEGGILGVLCVGPRHFPRRTEDNCEQLQLGWLVSASAFELVVSRIKIRNVTNGRDRFVWS